MVGSVYICSPISGYEEMFLDFGWDTVNSVYDCDLVQFTGGSDVTPGLYGQEPHPRTYCNWSRDRREVAIYQMARSLALPMAGICRGGQFLNVMNGGKLWQDVDGHAIGGTHEAVDVETGEVFDVTSTHHQMMIPAANGEIIVTANECKRRESMTPTGQKVKYFKTGEDVEAVYYKKTNSFCFQPHPEYRDRAPSLANKYFDYLDRYLFKMEAK